jgi:hypothetical protein
MAAAEVVRQPDTTSAGLLLDLLYDRDDKDGPTDGPSKPPSEADTDTDPEAADSPAVGDGQKWKVHDEASPSAGLPPGRGDGLAEAAPRAEDPARTSADSATRSDGKTSDSDSSVAVTQVRSLNAAPVPPGLSTPSSAMCPLCSRHCENHHRCDPPALAHPLAERQLDRDDASAAANLNCLPCVTAQAGQVLAEVRIFRTTVRASPPAPDPHSHNAPSQKRSRPI